MGDPALRDDSIDDDEYFSPEAFKPRAVQDDEFNSPEAFKPDEQPEPSFVRYEAPKPSTEPDALEMFLQSDRDGVPGVDENVTPEGAHKVGGALNAYAGGFDAKLDQRLPYVGDAIRNSRSRFASEEPGLAMGADMAGAVSSPINVAGKEKALANVVGQAAGGAMQGSARAFGDAGGKSTEDQLLDTFAGGKEGGELGGAFAAGGHALGGAADWVGDRAATLGNYLRRVAQGVSKSDVNQLVDEKGTAEGLRYAKEELGRLPDKLGIANKVWPKSKADYAKGYQAEREAGGAQKGASLDRADAVVPPEQLDFAKDDVLQRMVSAHDADARAFSSRGTEPTYRDLTQRLQDRPISKPSELDDMKQEYEGNSYAKGPGAMEEGAAAANKVAADETRNRLGGIISGANRLDPGIGQEFEQGSQRYQDAARGEGITKRAAAGQLVAPMLGGITGGLAGYGTRQDLNGAAGGVVAGAALGAGLRSHGADLGANMARPIEAIGHGANDVLQAAAQHGGQAAAAKQAMDSSRGHELPSVINNLLQSNPAALGRWRAEFENAGRTSGGIAGLLNKLQRDREWTSTKLPELQQMTGDQR